MGHTLSQHVIQEDKARQQRQCQQHLATQQKLEQQGFHGLQRREGMVEAHRIAVPQLVILKAQQSRLEGSDGQDAIGQDRQQHVHQ